MTNRMTTWQTVMLLFMHYMAFQLLMRFGGTTVTICVVVALAIMSGTIYLLRYDRAKAAEFYKRSPTREWIDFVCRCSKQQPPQEVSLGAATASLLLKSEEDFDWCVGRIKKDVFGHDDAIQLAVKSVQKNVLLQGRSETGAPVRPLGIFLMLGSPGIGRATLASQLGQRLFANGAVTAIDLTAYSDDYGVTRLFGAPGTDGALLEPVRKNPSHILILENIEAASSTVLTALQTLFVRGECVDGNHGGPVSFRNTVVFLLSSAMAGQSGDHPRAQLVDEFCSLTSCPVSLISLADECIRMGEPSDEVKARVLMRLMQLECEQYKVPLEYVDPEIVVDEVEKYSPSLGFEASQIRIARWISDPIHLAARHGMEALVLTKDLVSREPQQKRQHHEVKEPALIGSEL